MMKPLYLPLCVPVLCAVAGCASTPRVRELANTTGVYVQALDTGTSEFVEAQNRLNASNQSRLQLLDQRSDAFRTETRQQRFAWVDSADRQRLSALDSVSSRTAEAIVADLHARPLQPAAVRSSNGEAYSATAEALGTVATKPKPFTVLREFVTFAQAVNEGYAKLKKDAEQSTDAATGDATKIDGAALATATATSKPK